MSASPSCAPTGTAQKMLASAASSSGRNARRAKRRTKPTGGEGAGPTSGERADHERRRTEHHLGAHADLERQVRAPALAFSVAWPASPRQPLDRQRRTVAVDAPGEAVNERQPVTGGRAADQRQRQRRERVVVDGRPDVVRAGTVRSARRRQGRRPQADRGPEAEVGREEEHPMRHQHRHGDDRRGRSSDMSATMPNAARALRHSLRFDSRRTETTSPLMRYAISIDWDCFTADLAAVA